jgi:GT2 family glycosyltransferase
MVRGLASMITTPSDAPDGNAGTTACVSILIPVHNGLAFTRACLESIAATDDVSLVEEILVLDDGSDDGTAEYLDALGGRVRRISSETRQTFAEKINRAAPLARSEYLCLLNNDTTVTPGWLRSLLAAARDDPGAAIIGNRQLVPKTGLIDHAGVVFSSRGFPMHLYRGQPADFWPAQISQEFQVVTAACWLVTKRTFLELGGFDPVFRNGWEDVDFCLRARQKGLRVFYTAESVIYHHVSSTPGRTDHEMANVEYFQCKWAGTIVSDLDKFFFVPKPEPKPQPPPTPSPAAGAAPAGPSHMEKRYWEVERLHARHPLIASFLRSIIRSATSAAKLLNKISG